MPLSIIFYKRKLSNHKKASTHKSYYTTLEQNSLHFNNNIHIITVSRENCLFFCIRLHNHNFLYLLLFFCKYKIVLDCGMKGLITNFNILNLVHQNFISAKICYRKFLAIPVPPVRVIIIHLNVATSVICVKIFKITQDIS